MSATSIKNSFMVSKPAKDFCADENDSAAANLEPPLLEMLSLTSWRKLIVETFALLAVVTLCQRVFSGAPGTLGLPHPYWIPVLLASCQYGVNGGMIATVAASVLYFFELSTPTVADDFYAYAGMVTVQPAAWLAAALILGGLRSLHIHQSRELADKLAQCRLRANDLSNGLERAAAEINALERRIAVDMGSVAAFSRSLAQIDMSDRWAALMSFGELFRVATGTPTFTVYLKVADGYAPVWAVKENIVCSTSAMEALSSAAIGAMMAASEVRAAQAEAAKNRPGAGRRMVYVLPHTGSEPMAAIVCDLHPAQDEKKFCFRSEELSRAIATILSACPDRPRGAHT